MAATRKLNLILVDDDPAITRLVEHYLRCNLTATHSISSFNDPQQACLAIDEDGCDLLISDVQMPGMSGMEMLRFAKARNAWTQVIFMTAHSNWDSIAQAIEAGAADYLVKPLNKADLFCVVEQSCDRLRRWQKVLQATWQRPTNVPSAS